ncbi:hypothetical protein BGZ47_002521, partial [Haplosporangium gracile]
YNYGLQQDRSPPRRSLGCPSGHNRGSRCSRHSQLVPVQPQLRLVPGPLLQHGRQLGRRLVRREHQRKVHGLLEPVLKGRWKTRLLVL